MSNNRGGRENIDPLVRYNPDRIDLGYKLVSLGMSSNPLEELPYPSEGEFEEVVDEYDLSDGFTVIVRKSVYDATVVPALARHNELRNSLIVPYFHNRIIQIKERLASRNLKNPLFSTLTPNYGISQYLVTINPYNTYFEFFGLNINFTYDIDTHITYWLSPEFELNSLVTFLSTDYKLLNPTIPGKLEFKDPGIVTVTFVEIGNVNNYGAITFIS